CPRQPGRGRFARDMTGKPPRPRLVGLELGDPAELWRGLGFAVNDGQLELGGVRLAPRGEGRGITRWAIAGIDPTEQIDGLPTVVTERLASRGSTHPNGAIGLDHLVITTPDFDRTARALQESGMPLRRIRGAGEVRQGVR